jgi:glycosyltransferase involved in cell wall biosynthesis
MSNQKNEPLVSIGVPVVKSFFLEKCIKCLLQQTYSNIEIIVVNNSYNSKEGNLIETIVSKINENRIKYFRNVQHLPIIENWNKTLCLSEGDFFAILCDDDYWEPEFIEVMIGYTKRYKKVDIFHCRCLVINENDEVIDITPICPEYEHVTDFIYYRIKDFRMQYLSDFFIRAASLKAINGFVTVPDGWGSDDLTWFYLSLNGGIVYSSRTLCYYRETQTSITNTMKIKNKILATDIYISQIIKILDRIKDSKDFNPIVFKLILKQLYDFKKNKILFYKVEYLRRKYFLNQVLYVFALYLLKIKFKMLKHY